MLSSIKKLILSLVLSSFFLTSLFVPYARAQETWYYQDFFGWYEKVFDQKNPEEIFGERYTAAQVEWVIFSFFGWIINHVGVRDINWCAVNLMLQEGRPNLWRWIGGTFVDFFTECPCAADDICNILTFAALPPLQSVACGLVERFNPLCLSGSNVGTRSNNSSVASGIKLIPGWSLGLTSYVKGVYSKLNPISEVKAQGFGFTTGGNMVQKIWVLVRNLTYFFLVIAIVVVSFMIMFRVKLSPQTVITVQSAIPKIIMTLILITFSYAISGLLIDLMYVTIGLIASILSATLSRDSWEQVFHDLTQTSSVGLLIWYWIWWLVSALAASFQFFGLGIGNILVGLIMVVFWIILAFVLIIASFKIWWMLIKTFTSILILIAVSPLYILGGIFGFGGFGPWLKAILANLAVYPFIGLAFVMAFFFLGAALHGGSLLPFNLNIDQFFEFGATGIVNSWDPPLTFGTGAIELVLVFVSLSIITLIPKTTEIIKSLITEQPFAYGTAMGQALATGARIALWPFAQTFGAYREAQFKALGQMITEATTPFYDRLKRTFGFGRTSGGTS